MLDKIKGLSILKNIFKILQNKSKLLMLKYNKKLSDKLDIKLKDYQYHNLLVKLNNKFNLNIKDTAITNLELNNENINEILKDMSKIEFKSLKYLNISNNDLKDINILEKINCKKLEKLDLSFNLISDINILEKVNFKELKEIYFYKNFILSNIKILAKSKF